MEWLALAVWALVALVAIPAGGGALAAPALGLQPVIGLAGLVLSIVLAADGGDGAGVAWVAFGLALAGAATTGLGAAELMADDPEGAGAERSAELASVFAGIAWPLYLVATGVSLMAALAADGTL